ncbi:methylenetetrahydrofolate reductase [Asaia krungthepensis]|uniref:Methylenetetrahydrofolate reductase n=1 Tax=Asaia krungthepensis NRIC 0535 TaxID=1307925 RepID=A0ABQ0Q4T8_9PROT|nr:methylenetetrahydrofolate reductase [Asaia krungthepensis]GBQ91441.1 5,10-methylenetetrahydrofolate reductase [Asaia krungthepensis NRIC 0535]
MKPRNIGKQAARNLLHGYSIEVMPRAMAGNGTAARGFEAVLPEGLDAMIPHLSTTDDESRLATAQKLHSLGINPVPHFAARRVSSTKEITVALHHLVTQTQIDACFVIAGDPALVSGPFQNSLSLIGTGVFERAGIRKLAIGGYPEGHRHMTAAEAWQSLEAKCRDITERGMSPEIITQFCFDSRAVLTWLAALRERGITCPVRVGVPGPATIGSLIRFAAACGVEASTSVLAQYGIAMGKLLGTTGPDRLIDDLAEGLGSAHGAVSLHFHPFGGIECLMKWLGHYQ